MKNSAQFFTGFAAIVGIILYILVYLNTDWSLYFIWLIALGGATFLLYLIDKVQAKLGNWRIPESTLHTFVLLGGVVGGWVGMVLIWHKVRKPMFWVVLVVSSIIHTVLLIWLL